MNLILSRDIFYEQLGKFMKEFRRRFLVRRGIAGWILGAKQRVVVVRSEDYDTIEAMICRHYGNTPIFSQAERARRYLHSVCDAFLFISDFNKQCRLEPGELELLYPICFMIISHYEFYDYEIEQARLRPEEDLYTMGNSIISLEHGIDLPNDITRDMAKLTFKNTDEAIAYDILSLIRHYYTKMPDSTKCRELMARLLLRLPAQLRRILSSEQSGTSTSGSL